MPALSVSKSFLPYHWQSTSNLDFCSMINESAISLTNLSPHLKSLVPFPLMRGKTTETPAQSQHLRLICLLLDDSRRRAICYASVADLNAFKRTWQDTPACQRSVWLEEQRALAEQILEVRKHLSSSLANLRITPSTLSSVESGILPGKRHEETNLMRSNE